MNLTPKQLEILSFISGFQTKKGYAPSQTEIAKHFGFKSLGTVQNYLVRLEREGALKREWNAKRALTVVEPKKPKSKTYTMPPAESQSMVQLSLLGRVAAGKPIEAIESDQTVEIPPSMIAQKDIAKSFVLRVAGDSMIGDGILDGDLLIVKKTTDATNGQTVVASLNHEATVKRFYKRAGRIELHAANPAYDPIIVDSLVDFAIEGVVSGVIRRLG